jgi:hypothetical protein
MKKITLKISAFLFVALSAFQANAQEIHTEIVEGTVYNLRNVKSNQYLKAAGGDVASTAEVLSTIDYDENDANINWSFVAVEYEGNPYWNVQAQARGILRMKGTKQVISTAFQGPRADVDKINIVTYDADAGGFRIFNRTETQSLTNQEHANGSLSNVLKADAVDNEDVWVLEVSEIEEPTASTDSFGVDAFSISNPINNQLIIKGATSKVNEISLYSILGGKVLTKIINTQSAIDLDVSSLASGLYIVEVKGDSGRFTQKLIKQ